MQNNSRFVKSAPGASVTATRLKSCRFIACCNSSSRHHNSDSNAAPPAENMPLIRHFRPSNSIVCPTSSSPSRGAQLRRRQSTDQHFARLRPRRPPPAPPAAAPAAPPASRRAPVPSPAPRARRLSRPCPDTAPAKHTSARTAPESPRRSPPPGRSCSSRSTSTRGSRPCRAKTRAPSRVSPLTASDRSSPRMKPTTTNTIRITVVRPANVSAVRSGRRNRFRIAYSQGSKRKKNIGVDSKARGSNRSAQREARAQLNANESTQISVIEAAQGPPVVHSHVRPRRNRELLIFGFVNLRGNNRHRNDRHRPAPIESNNRRPRIVHQRTAADTLARVTGTR